MIKISSPVEVEKLGTLRSGSLAPWVNDLSHTHGCSWSKEASYRYCQKIVRQSDPNLSLWMHLIPKQQAKALAAVYAVARVADDLTDEEIFSPLRQSALQSWKTSFEDACNQKARHPAMVALADSMSRFDVDPDLVNRFLSSCIEESGPLHFENWNQVEEFAKSSFGSLGKVVMGILGLERSDLMYWAERMSVALFITCRLRDLSVDLPRQKVFLPSDHLAEYGLDLQTLLNAPPTDSLSLAISSAVERTRWIYREAYPLVVEAGGYATALLAGVWLGGRTLLRLVDRSSAALLYSRPGLSVFTFARTMMGAGLERLPGVVT